VLRLFDDGKTLSPRELYELLEKKTPLPTIKQSLARLVKLRLLKRIGLGRATRYRKL